MTDPLDLLKELGGPIAHAYREAERRKAEADAEEARREEALPAEAERHVYDPRPYPEAVPHDRDMYEGTGIGALYGLPGCERFLSELDDWTLGKENA